MLLLMVNSFIILTVYLTESVSELLPFSIFIKITDDFPNKWRNLIRLVELII